MPGWAIWTVIVAWAWLAIAVSVAVVVRARPAARAQREPEPESAPDADEPVLPVPTRIPLPVPAPDPARRRLLLVDDDPGLRMLLRTTLSVEDCTVEEAATAEEARDLARFWRPSLVVLDVGLPGMSGLALCRELVEKPVFESPRVILLTGDEVSAAAAEAVGADALLRKPFSPLDLLATIDRVLDGERAGPHSAEPAEPDQLLAYAQDLSRIVQVERAQRRLLQHAYRQTVTAFTDALEARSRATGRHALRVHRYALELTEAVEPTLLDDPSLEYGFLLHDIGKIGVPDSVLEKDGPLSDEELTLMQQHPLIGADLLADVPLLDGEGLQVVRSHHERWDGRGYPDGLTGEEIPIGARIFAVADALDAMTSERPYRGALEWEEAVDTVLRESGSQFDPRVVGAFALRERRLRRTRRELAGMA
jgi:ribonuclease P protein subunit RPR2